MHNSNLAHKKFSVLMSIYYKENPDWFKLAVQSVIEQTVRPDEVLIVQDGRLTPELYAVCQELQDLYPKIVHYLPLKQNCGLGIALQHGVLACRNELIARMDTDDISLPNRFELQLNEFANNPKLDVCGGYIQEFIDNPNTIQAERKVPLLMEDIYEYGKKRNPLNHVTIMFRKNAVLSAGNYQSFPLMEDYYLWFRMIMNHNVLQNIPQPLVLVRTGQDMVARRGGWSYFKHEVKLYQVFKQKNYLNEREYILILMIRFIARIVPSGIRTFFYKYFLR